jgi:hypothetical protein
MVSFDGAGARRLLAPGTIEVAVGGCLPNGSLFEGWTTVTVIDPVIPATAGIEPQTINLKSNGRTITAYIELPTDYDASNIDASTVTLSTAAGYIVALLSPSSTGDWDNDGVPDRMVKFDRAVVRRLLDPGVVDVTLAGTLLDGRRFEGTTSVTVISPAAADSAAGIPAVVERVSDMSVYAQRGSLLKGSAGRSHVSHDAAFDEFGRIPMHEYLTGEFVMRYLDHWDVNWLPGRTAAWHGRHRHLPRLLEAHNDRQASNPPAADVDRDAATALLDTLLADPLETERFDWTLSLRKT